MYVRSQKNKTPLYETFIKKKMVSQITKLFIVLTLRNHRNNDKKSIAFSFRESVNPRLHA